MCWNTPRGRLLLILSALVIVVTLATIFRARQAAQQHARQQHELELMKKGGLEFMNGVGTPSKAMEQTGDPFTPRSTTNPAKPAEEKQR